MHAGRPTIQHHGLTPALSLEPTHKLLTTHVPSHRVTDCVGRDTKRTRTVWIDRDCYLPSSPAVRLRLTHARHRCKTRCNLLFHEVIQGVDIAVSSTQHMNSHHETGECFGARRVDVDVGTRWLRTLQIRGQPPQLKLADFNVATGFETNSKLAARTADHAPRFRDLR